MIFGRLFKKKKKVDATEEQTDTQNVDVQTPALSQQYDGDASSLSDRLSKRTKTEKKNTAFNRRKRQRSSRVVHTKRSFHRINQRPVGEQVHVYDVIERPVITEKAANQSEKGVYTFLVYRRANKHMVADAVEALYNVRPKKVRIAKQPSRRRRLRVPGKEREYGMTTQRRKAYVFLREGDTITLT